jgi:hypothetical protein
MNLREVAGDSSKIKNVLSELQYVVAAAKGLVSYPMDVVIDIIKELGKLFVEDSQYDELLESVLTVAQKRISEKEAGKILLGRGFQILEKKPYDAIRFFGRAQVKLALRESRDELIASLAGCGHAYRTVGLLWAARGKMLAAANQAFSAFNECGVVLPQALICLRRLVWLELQLGRIPYAMRWMSISSTIAGQLLDETQKKEYFKELGDQDRVMGILVLKTTYQDLKALDFLPSVLDKSNLTFSWMALLYALGYEDYLRTEKVIPESETPGAAKAFFLSWLEQPAAKDMPEQPEYLLGDHTTLQSRVIGCAIKVETQNDLIPICLGERILASIEAFLATSIGDDVFAHQPEFRIELVESAIKLEQPEVEFDDKSSPPSATVRYCKSMPGGEGKDSKWLLNLMLAGFNCEVQHPV